jgi:acyl carrier protein
VDDSGHQRLVAYFVPARGLAVTPQELRSVVAAELPQHMVPGLFVALDALPLSFNGKVDRQALSKRPLPAPTHAADLAAEGSALESAISELWRNVLQRDAVGLDDNFFDLGGDSLLLVSVHSRLQKRLNREISLTDLFEYPTVRGLARHLSNSEQRVDFVNAQDSAQQQRQAFHRWRERRSAVDRE